MPGITPPKSAPKENVLEIANRITSGDRRNAYGHPLDDFSATAIIWTGILRRAGLLAEDVELTPEIVQVLMVGLKLTRAAGTNGQHRDSLIDIAGYARTIEMCQEERAARDFPVEQPQIRGVTTPLEYIKPPQDEWKLPDDHFCCHDHHD